MGDYTIERFLIGVFVFVLIILAMVFKNKRKIFIGLIGVVLVGYLIFFFVRGQMIENQYQRSIVLVNEYLENQYSEEEWTVSDRLSKGQMRRSNKVDIVFTNEKEVIYTYKVLENGQIVQWEISLGGEQIEDLKHNEK